METVTVVLAQAQGGANPIVGLLPFFLIMLIFYFLLIVPQRRQLKQHQEMVAALKTGDEVVTAGGLIGVITAVKDDSVVLKTGQSTVVVERARISRLMRAQGAAAVEKK